MDDKKKRHGIKKCIFDFQLPSKQEAIQYHNTVKTLFIRNLEKIIEEILDEYQIPGYTISFNKIEIDLGEISSNNLEKALLDAFPKALRKYLDTIYFTQNIANFKRNVQLKQSERPPIPSNLIRPVRSQQDSSTPELVTSSFQHSTDGPVTSDLQVQPTPVAEIPTFINFLKTGNIPTHSTLPESSLDDWVNQTFEAFSSFLIQELKKIIHLPYVQLRIHRQLSKDTVQKIEKGLDIQLKTEKEIIETALSSSPSASPDTETSTSEPIDHPQTPELEAEAPTTITADENQSSSAEKREIASTKEPKQTTPPAISTTPPTKAEPGETSLEAKEDEKPTSTPPTEEATPEITSPASREPATTEPDHHPDDRDVPKKEPSETKKASPDKSDHHPDDRDVPKKEPPETKETKPEIRDQEKEKTALEPPAESVPTEKEQQPQPIDRTSPEKELTPDPQDPQQQEPTQKETPDQPPSPPQKEEESSEKTEEPAKSKKESQAQNVEEPPAETSSPMGDLKEGEKKDQSEREKEGEVTRKRESPEEKFRQQEYRTEETSDQKPTDPPDERKKGEAEEPFNEPVEDGSQPESEQLKSLQKEKTEPPERTPQSPRESEETSPDPPAQEGNKEAVEERVLEEQIARQQLAEVHSLKIVVTFIRTGAPPVYLRRDFQPSDYQRLIQQLLKDHQPDLVAEILLQHIAPKKILKEDYYQSLKLISKSFEELPESQQTARTQQLVQAVQQVIKAQPKQTKGYITQKSQFSLGDQEELYIKNGGLILVWPFLGHYFKTMEMLNEDRQFHDAETAFKAIHILEFIATRNTVTPEHLLALNKILCGVPITEPIPMEVELEQKAKDLAESMLKAILKQWPGMDKSSPDGLRGGFLIRDARLTQKNENWTLRVDPKAYDVLLDRIKWGISLIKLPWMPNMLTVEWR